MRNTLKSSSADDCPHVHLHISFPHLPSASNSKLPPPCIFCGSGEWWCHLVLWEIRGKSTGANAPQQALPRGERQTICCRLFAHRNAPCHFTGALLTAFLESAHWNMLKASTALPRATVQESCSVAMLCLWKMLSCWLDASSVSWFIALFYMLTSEMLNCKK